MIRIDLARWTFFFILVLELFGCGKISSNCTVPPHSILGWWSGDGISNQTVSNWVGSIPGVLNNDVSITSGLSSASKAFSFNGSSSIISISDNSSLDLSQGFSVATFAKSSPGSTAPGLIQTLASKWTYPSSSDFISSSSWQGVDVAAFSGMATDGVSPWSSFVGFLGGGFDGRYMYFSPSGGTTAKLLRYDVTLDFSSKAGWQGIDVAGFPGLATDNTFAWSSIKLYRSAIYDGRYVYFSGQSGRFARYDTQKEFSSAAAWEGVAVSAFSGDMGDGVTAWSSFSSVLGAAFDGRYLLLNGVSGPVIKYDTQGSFTSPSSWKGVGINSFSGNTTDGVTPWSQFNSMNGAGFDGRYFYLPGYPSGKVARYDSKQEITAQSSWEGLNLAAFSGQTSDGSNWSSVNQFTGSIFDGRYVYLINQRTSTLVVHVRYDTQKPFNNQNSWDGVNVTGFSGTLSDGSTTWSNMRGSAGGIFDGRYLYLFSVFGSSYASRYDTLAPFTAKSSWDSLNLASLGGLASDGVTPWSAFGKGYSGGFDGRYSYYVQVLGSSGKIARFDTAGANSFTYLKYTDLISDGLSTTFSGPSFSIRGTVNSGLAFRAKTLSQDNWHHIVGTYDGRTCVKLYVDGVLESTVLASPSQVKIDRSIFLGSLLNSAYLKGAIADFQMYSSELSAQDVQTMYVSGQNWCRY